MYYSDTICWMLGPIMHIFCVKPLSQNFLNICKPEIEAAFQLKPEFYAQHLSNSVPNHLNAHKCEGTRLKCVCMLHCIYWHLNLVYTHKNIKILK